MASRWTAFDSSLGAGTGNSISSNSIFGNQKLGIDLGGDGVTSNHDSLTTASGPNHLQNYPVLSSATFSSGQTTMAGTLAGLANRDYTLEFFTNVFVDPSNFGEGQTFLGQGTAHTDSSGNVTFSIPIDSADTRGLWVTATATTPNPQFNAFGSDTSEFSQAVLVTGVPPATPFSSRAPTCRSPRRCSPRTRKWATTSSINSRSRTTAPTWRTPSYSRMRCHRDSRMPRPILPRARRS